MTFSIVHRQGLLTALLVCAHVVALASESATAAYYRDRWYRMGDDPGEPAQPGQPAGTGATLGLTFDSAGSFQDLTPFNSPLYVDISADKPFPNSTLDTRAISFNGTQYLYGHFLNNPSEAAASTGQSENYTGITNRGYQMWVKPSSPGGTEQSILDDADTHRALINANGNFGFEIRTSVLTPTAPATTAWTHIAQVRPNGDFGGSVGYVNGRVVVSQTGDYPSSALNLVIGANIESDGLGGEVITPQFNGLVSDVEMFVFGPSFGTYDYTTDNGYFTDVFLPSTSGYGYADANQNGHNDVLWKKGDINFDGVLNAADITAFIAGWRSTNAGTFLGGGPGFGDYVTLGQGDLNLDGRVDVDDWVVLRSTGISPIGDLSALLGQSVPEPTSLALLLGSCLLLAGRRRGAY